MYISYTITMVGKFFELLLLGTRYLILIHMRLNKFIAFATGISRRDADRAILEGRVTVNGSTAIIGHVVDEADSVQLDGKELVTTAVTTLSFNKPVGFVCSRDGQGSPTIYELLPPEYHHLKPVGRLDKDSSGLLLLTNDGSYAHTLTHPSFEKQKIYEVTLNKGLSPRDKTAITNGIPLHDGISKLQFLSSRGTVHKVVLHEGRNRQIRRTFEERGYTVKKLHRIQFGNYELHNLAPGGWQLA